MATLKELIRGNELIVAPVVCNPIMALLAQEAGLDTIAPRPVCMATRRVSQPGLTRDVFFLRLELPPFDAFRREVSQRLTNAGRAASFDPAGLSPVVIIAASDDEFSSWLPLRAEEASDCQAPIEVH